MLPKKLRGVPLCLTYAIRNLWIFYGSLLSRTALVPVRDFNIRENSEGARSFYGTLTYKIATRSKR